MLVLLSPFSATRTTSMVSLSHFISDHHCNKHCWTLDKHLWRRILWTHLTTITSNGYKGNHFREALKKKLYTSVLAQPRLSPSPESLDAVYDNNLFRWVRTTDLSSDLHISGFGHTDHPVRPPLPPAGQCLELRTLLF